jgi:DNA-binding response OmpR family regulator
MAHILVIEDHQSLLRSVTTSLEESGWQVDGASTLAAADRRLDSSIDLIILDLMLPDGSGLDWLSRVRSGGLKTRVLILTARDAVEDRVTGLDAGADDYLVKPFALSELLARVRAILRRDGVPESHALSLQDLTIDLVNRKAMRAGRLLSLQNRQFELLAYLLKFPNQIVTREMIARDVWKEQTATWTNVIEVQVNQLRKQLDLPGETPLLHTVRNQGYVLGEVP